MSSTTGVLVAEQTAQEAGLEKAREVLRRRRRFAREVESQEAKLSVILLSPFDSRDDFLPDWLKTVKLGTMLRWLPGVGPATVEKILRLVPANEAPHTSGGYTLTPVLPSESLSSLSYKQRVALSLLIEKYER